MKISKYLKSVLLLILVPLFISNCGGDEDEPVTADKVLPSQSQINVEGECNEVKVSINSTCSWHAMTDRDWIAISPSTGSPGVTTMNVTFTKNYGSDSRTGEIKIVNYNTGNVCCTISVVQKSSDNPSSPDNPINPEDDYKVSFSPDSLSVSKDSGGYTYYVYVTSKHDLSIGNGCKWIKVNEEHVPSGNHVIYVQVDDNDSTYPRECDLRFVAVDDKGADHVWLFHIYQEGDNEVIPNIPVEPW